MRRRRQEPLHSPPLSYLFHRTARPYSCESAGTETNELNNSLLDFTTTDSDNDDQNDDDNEDGDDDNDDDDDDDEYNF